MISRWSDLDGIHFDRDRPEGIRFHPADDQNLNFALLPNSEKDPSGFRRGLTCKAFASYVATQEEVAFVESYNTHKVMLRVRESLQLPYPSKGETLIANDGSFASSFLPRRYLCPSDIRALIEKAETELSAHTDRFLTLLRWRQGFQSPAQIVRSQSLYWRVGTGLYPIAPPSGTPGQVVEVGEAMAGLHWDDEDREDLTSLWKEHGLSEPLAHILMREATALAVESPRSSILMMTTALETGVKMHISRIAPDTAWLMEEVPSPPLFKMLRDYIPELHRRRGEDMKFWEHLKPFLKNAQKLVEVRNKVAHTGNVPEDAGPITDQLTTVNDLLYVLDVLEGREWAKTLASHSLQKALNWPGPKRQRIYIQVMEPN